MSLYISITGLTLRTRWHAPRFWWHATRAMAEARAHPGCHSASARTVAGIHHTLSVWDSRDAMRTYLTAPRHRAAMRAFPAIATGRTVGFEAQAAPAWPEALSIWNREAKPVGPA